MSSKSKIEIILSAIDRGVSTVFTRAEKAVKVFNSTAGNGIRFVNALEGAVGGLVGAFIGMQAIRGAAEMMRRSGQAAFDMATSIKAANREFSDVGSAQSWNNAIGRLSGTLEVYSNTELAGAVSRTVDMTKRLGLNAEQMEKVIELTGDLSAGKTDLNGGIERVTAALRGEAEASEYLGLTLNETYVKSWYEAKGAMQGAWKDLADMQKAQVRYNVLLEQALPMQGRAAASANTLAGAVALVRKEIDNAVTSNGDAVAATEKLAAVIRDNSASFGQMVSAMVTAAARTVEWVVRHKEAAFAVAEWTAKIYLAIKAMQGLGMGINLIKGINAAILALSGTSLAGWATTTVQALRTVNLAALPLGGVLKSVAGVLAAGFVGWEIGTLLNQFDIVQKAGIGLAHGLTMAWLKVREAWEWMTGGDTEKIRREMEIARQTYVSMIDEINGKARQSAAQQVQAQSTVTEAVRQSAGSQQQVSGDALKTMQDQYKAYVAQIKSLQKEITDQQRSLAAELREMGRSGMSDIAAWKDRKNEASEYYAAAQAAVQQGQAALQAGDQATAALKFDEAKRLANDAKEAYKALNTEVKDGDQVLISRNEALKTAMSGVEQAGQLAATAMQQQQAAAVSAMEGLVSQAGLENLTAGMDAAEQAWLANWRNMQSQSMAAIEAVEQRIIKMVRGDHTVFINVDLPDLEKFRADNAPAGYRLGGLIQRLAAGGGVRNILGGGHLPGFGGGDRRLLLGEDGEVMLNKHVVRAAGLRAALAFNSGRFDVVLEELSRRTRARIGYHLGGFVSSLPEIPASVQRLAEGGEVTGAGASAVPSRVVELRFAGGQVHGDERSVEMLLQHLETAGLSA